ncbi:MAG TPA: formylglycine-generating enzyme family protein [Nitrospirae bacterium]|nr:formylglycine-generating enzyme family protein [Nitrospirota bacterium]
MKNPGIKVTLSYLFIFMALCLISACRQYTVRPDMSKDMVLVKGGCFRMGDIFSDAPSGEEPVHEVCVDDFYMGKYEVTVGEFRRFVTESGYMTEAEQQDGCHGWVDEGAKLQKMDIDWSDTGFPQTDNDPVVCITWNDAHEYVQWLNKKQGRNYRLPTEAEWEYAARSRGKEYQYSWGNKEPSGNIPLGNIADESAKKELPRLNIRQGYRDGYAYTAPVGSFRPNELGIYDMSGNAYEWLADWQEDNYYANSPRRNPEGPDKGKYRVLRGGAWDLVSETARTTRRHWNIPGARAVCMGFRLAHPAE